MAWMDADFTMNFQLKIEAAVRRRINSAMDAIER